MRVAMFGASGIEYIEVNDELSQIKTEIDNTMFERDISKILNQGNHKKKGKNFKNWEKNKFYHRYI